MIGRYIGHRIRFEMGGLVVVAGLSIRSIAAILSERAFCSDRQRPLDVVASTDLDIILFSISSHLYAARRLGVEMLTSSPL